MDRMMLPSRIFEILEKGFAYFRNVREIKWEGVTLVIDIYTEKRYQRIGYCKMICISS